MPNSKVGNVYPPLFRSPASLKYFMKLNFNSQQTKPNLILERVGNNNSCRNGKLPDDKVRDKTANKKEPEGCHGDSVGTMLAHENLSGSNSHSVIHCRALRHPNRKRERLE